MADETAPKQSGIIEGTGLEPYFPQKKDESGVIESQYREPQKQDPGLAGWQARVEEARPEARARVASSPAYMNYLPGDVPFISPLFHNMYASALARSGSGKGDTYDERRANILAEMQATREERSKASPFGRAVGEITTGVAMLPASASIGISKGVTSALEAGGKFVPSILQKYAPLAGQTAESAVIGGLSGLSEAKPGETAEETAKRVGTSAAVGAAAPAVVTGLVRTGAAAAKPVGNALQALWNPEAAAARKIAEGASKAPTSRTPGMTIDEYERAVLEGRPVRPIDIHGAKEQVERAGAAFEGDQRFADINRFLRDRVQGNTQRIHQDVDSAFGQPIDAFAIRQASDAAARQQNAPAYNAAFRDPAAQAVWTPNIRQTFSTNEGKQAIEWAANEGAKWSTQSGRTGTIQSPFIHNTDGTLKLDINGNPQLKQGVSGPSLEFLDLVKRGLTDIGKQQQGQAGASTRAMAASFADELYSMFRPYQQAATGAGKYIKANNAFDAGASFMDMAKMGRGPSLGDLSRQKHQYARNFTPEERTAFQQGIGAWIKENPAEATALFQKGDRAVMDPIRAILGRDRFADIDNSLRINRIMAMNEAVAAREGKAAQIVKGWGPIGQGVGIGAGISAAPTVLPRIAEMAQTKMGLAGLAVGVPVGLASYIGNRRRMNELLSMAVSDDPRQQQMILEAARKQASTANALKELEQRLGRYVAAKVAEADDEGAGKLVRSERASGGRVSDKLVAMVDRSKRNINNETKTLLNTDDNKIAHALEIANRHLEG